MTALSHAAPNNVFPVGPLHLGKKTTPDATRNCSKLEHDPEDAFEAMTTTRKKKPRLRRATNKPEHEKLTWPGLKAKDYFTRLVTRAVKEAKETREKEAWAENQIARVLDYVSAETAMRLLLQKVRGRGRQIPPQVDDA